MSAVEEWRPWRDGDYEVSSLGRVRRAKPGRRTNPGRPVKPTLMRVGYLSVGHTINGSPVRTYVHVMVADAFLPRQRGRTEINHRDGDKTNNAVTNLERVTHAENMAHAARIGLMRRGSTHPGSKLTESNVRQMRSMWSMGVGLGAICAQFGIAKPTASMIVNGLRWRHVP